MTAAAPIPERCWSRGAGRRLAVVTAVAAAVLVLTAFGAGAQRSLDRQLLWIDLAVVASVVSAAAQVLFVLAGRRSVCALRRAVLERRAPGGEGRAGA
jgi:hypothetical protein